MSNHDTALKVAEEARKILGDHADAWMQRPSKLLDGMAPADLAHSKDGARVVLIELERAKTPLKAAVRTRRA
ncbi:MAG TPA: antitoxin Xre/MbcA/ParS toxin-binding domain-containing protein [Stellaceae bacterium]|nr:antitoxin Xre/MbcA/ParS toxin-binding domain-containing protein [Stellaceae bacterium]